MGKSKSGDLEAQVPDHIQSRYTAAHECVSEEALAHLKTYKYSSVDKSYVSRYILKHYWNAFVEILPLWLAPNMVTLLGFFFILANVGLLELYVPDLVGPAPNWVYYSFAFGLWMYSTMDNVDGKQARRTGTSSGLGELFDHGIDSLNCTLGSLLETAAMGYGATKTGAFTALIPCLPMFFSTWETYHTHTLYLGYFNGPTEGLIIACSMMIMSAQYGPEIWSSSLIKYFPSLENYISPLTTFREFWIPILLSSFVIAHLPACVVNVVKARRANGLPVGPVFYEWTPIVIFTAATCAWLGSPYSFILEDWDSKQKTGGHLVLWCVIMSLVFGRMTTKIILAHLTRQPFPYWTIMLVPMIVGAIIVNLPFLGIGWTVTESFELWYLRIYFVFAAVVYAKWAVLVINSICTYLGINCLTIPQGRDSFKESEKTSPNSVEPDRRVTRSMANGNGGRKSD
ncbi:ethanolaminephosphotransferase 1 [Phyllosticta paracitricarpa]|uniref:Ethanolaminephosphotransferase 1 n=1 Tax=Phyllosticta citricarpa TaxID=55181 RepID=A0ABR1MG16_9PEZI